MQATSNESLRRLVLVIGAIVFVDTMFYAAIAPLLPTLSHQLSLSKLSAGVMTASYPLGTLVGSLPGGVLAARAGPRFAVCTGLTLLAASTLAFGFLGDAVSLDAARFIEGVGGACSWAGGLAWIVAEAPAERRGGLIGAALGAAIGGALFGPIIGTIATVIGRGAAFSGVVVIAAVLIVLARRLPSTHVPSQQGMRELRAAVAERPVAVGMWLVALPAIASGMLNVLGPLRLHRLGAAAAAIGATYLVAAAIEALISPLIGRLSDRRGRSACRCASASPSRPACWPASPCPTTAVGLAALVVAIAAALGAFWAPGDGDALRRGRANRPRSGTRGGADEPGLGGRADRRLGRWRRGRQERRGRGADARGRGAVRDHADAARPARSA